jgi:hypothetical protein
MLPLAGRAHAPRSGASLVRYIARRSRSSLARRPVVCLYTPPYQPSLLIYVSSRSYLFSVVKYPFACSLGARKDDFIGSTRARSHRRADAACREIGQGPQCGVDTKLRFAGSCACGACPSETRWGRE